MSELPKDVHLEVVTPAGMVIDERVKGVAAPGHLGEFEARPGHQPYLVSLNSGRLAFTPAGGGARRVFTLGGGTAEVRADHVIVLADSCEPVKGS